MTDVQNEQFQIVDTVQIQADSLIAVMNHIGYQVDRAGQPGDKRKPTGGFITHNPRLKANRNIGTETAVKIHNATRRKWVKVSDGWYKIDIPGVNICLSAYALENLFAKKLVHKVKFQKSRKAANHVVLQGNMVKPVNRAYISLFGLVK